MNIFVNVKMNNLSLIVYICHKENIFTFRKSFPNGVFNGDGEPRFEREAKFLMICKGDEEVLGLLLGVLWLDFLRSFPGEKFSSLNCSDIFYRIFTSAVTFFQNSKSQMSECCSVLQTELVYMYSTFI